MLLLDIRLVYHHDLLLETVRLSSTSSGFSWYELMVLIPFWYTKSPWRRNKPLCTLGMVLSPVMMFASFRCLFSLSMWMEIGRDSHRRRMFTFSFFLGLGLPSACHRPQFPLHKSWQVKSAILLKLMVSSVGRPWLVQTHTHLPQHSWFPAVLLCCELGLLL